MHNHVTTPSSSAPGSPVSARPSSSSRPASTTSSSCERATASARHLARQHLSRCGVRYLRRCCTRSRSSRTRRGHGPTPRPREIRQHIEAMVESGQPAPQIQFGVEVNGVVVRRGREGAWTVKTAGREHLRARTVILASGPLPDHKWPDIRGIDTYEGHKIHSACWDHDYDFTGKRVAVIGTGASAVQIMPELVKAGRLRQGVPAHPGLGDAPRGHRHPPGGEALFAKVPAAQQLARAGPVLGSRGERHRDGVGHPADRGGARGSARPTCAVRVKDPWLRRQLTPTSRLAASGCWSPATTTRRCNATTASSSTGRSPR